ncbi:MAG TPA: glycoside hydrolase family 3 C-terminal domain-containing protein [Jatrophihabitans sp.]|nr:glycoside hydrolase family 3 C-terminal domain-containing protein [Jatrophihabitans sp.]
MRRVHLVRAAAAAGLVAGTLVAALPVAHAAPDSPWLDASEPALQRAEQVVAQMTLDEKITELHGIQNSEHQRYVPGIARLGIPEFRITNGPAGVGPSDDRTQKPATALPAPVSLAATWDPAAAYRNGDVTGAETKDLAHSLLEGPDINIARVPRNGRTFEGYGEDPYLAGQLAAANINGIQHNDVIAEVKHYTANNQETNRFSVNEVIDNRTLHEIYLPQFEAAVQDGHPGSVMCAYPKINGEFACQNSYLLKDVLRGQWGFDGFVQSDFGAAHSTVPSAEAGMDLEMPNGVYYADAMKQAVESGQISEQAIDTLLVRRFTVMIEFGLFDHPLTSSPIPVDADGAVARHLAEEGTVLLRNQNGQLPLDAQSVHSVAVIGPFAGAAMTGGGGSSHVKPLYTVSPVQGIQNRLQDATVSYNDGADPTAAAAVAKSADVALVMVGDNETEGSDRPNLALSGNQDQLIQAVAAANPHTVVVIKSGGPVLMPWLDEVPAVVEAWYPGEEDGNAVAALLFGDVNPSGKLPITFPVSDAQTPANTPAQYPGVDGTATYSEGLQVGYRWYDANNETPLFPFGFGLSYTSFKYSNLVVSPELNHNGRVTVEVDVTNTGSRAGADVAQVYVTDPSAAGEPPLQLKGFQRVQLAPQQTKHLVFQLDERAFSIWNSDAQAWTTVDGQYRVHVGDSSVELPLSAPVTVARTPGVQPLTVHAPDVVEPGDTATVTTTFGNTGDYPANAATVRLAAPAGWQVSPGGTVSLADVAPRSQVDTTWHVTVPADAQPGTGTLTATASYVGVDGASRSTGTADVAVPYRNLAAAFDNTGITDDSDPSAGAFASSGKTYSAQALAAAGITPGNPVSYDGTSFTWPDVAAGQPDNVEANGEVIAASGSGSTLALLGAGTNGTQGGTGTVYYADGSSSQFTASFADWWTPTAADQVVATMPYQNAPTGKYDHTASLYYTAVPIDSGKSVIAVELPTTGSSPGPGMHVFAMAVR